jgi:hypothetical protein
MECSEELTDKYGDDVPMKTALLLETIEAGKRYMCLLKLTDNMIEDDESDEVCRF